MKVLKTSGLSLSGAAEAPASSKASAAPAPPSAREPAGWSPALGGGVIAGGLEARAAHVDTAPRSQGPSDVLRAQSGLLDAPVRRRGRTSELRVASPEALRRGLEGEARAAYRGLALLALDLRAVLARHGIGDD
jgi:hypothetical protein